MEKVQGAFVLFGIMSARYVVIAGAAFLYFWVWKKDSWGDRRIQHEFPDKSKMWYEVRYSFLSFAVFTLLGVGIMFARQAGLTKIYTSISDYGWAYFFASIVIMVLVHDTYFYWAHRFMHIPGIYQYTHKVHHNSKNPSPWASFSFHPSEAVLEMIITPIFIFTMPVHPVALMVFMMFMTMMNVLGHLGYELYPSGFTRSKWTLWNNTSTHHNMHHKYVNCNYGLYFNWWDRIMKTNHRKYHETFEEVVNQSRGKHGPMQGRHEESTATAA